MNRSNTSMLMPETISLRSKIRNELTNLRLAFCDEIDAIEQRLEDTYGYKAQENDFYIEREEHCVMSSRLPVSNQIRRLPIASEDSIQRLGGASSSPYSAGER